MGNVKEMQSQPKELPQPEGEQFEQQDKVVLDYKLGWSWNSNTDAENWLIWKDPDAGKDWRQKEKGMTEDEMVGRHYQLHGHEFE